MNYIIREPKRKSFCKDDSSYLKQKRFFSNNQWKSSLLNESVISFYFILDKCSSFELIYRNEFFNETKAYAQCTKVIFYIKN